MSGPIVGRVSTPDLAAPHWLRQLVTQKPVPIPWKRAMRAAIGIAGPIAVGMIVGHVGIGVLISIGALCVTFADTDAPYRVRAQRLAAAGSAGTVGYLLGAVLGHHGVLTSVVLVGIAGLSALISATGSTASMAGLQLLVFAVLGSSQQADPLLAVGCFLGGAVFAWVLALAAWPVRGVAIERAAVAGVYDELAAVLAASGTGGARQARLRLTDALNRAYDVLLTARSRLAGRDRAYRRLFMLVTKTTPVVEAAVALIHSRRQPPQEYVDYLADAADRIRNRQPLTDPPQPPAGAKATALLHTGLLAVAEFRRGDDDSDDRADDAKAGPRERLLRLRDNVIAGRVTWMIVLRLTLCVGIAELAAALLPLEHSYWVVLTVAIVLKPDFGSVFGRAVLRGAGTAVGVMIGAGVLAIDPPAWGLVVLVAVAAIALPIGQVRNYGMFSTFVTPLVIVQLDLANAGNWSLVTARLLDTVLGCVIVLVFGYQIWPGERRPRVGQDFADALDKVADYLAHGLSEEPHRRSSLRRDAYRVLSDLRTTFQQSLVEPSAAGRQASAWWPVIIGLENLTDAVTAAAVAIARGTPPADQAEVAVLASAVREAAAAVRDQRAPKSGSLPENEQLAKVSAEVDAVHATLRGPDLGRRPRRRILPRVRGRFAARSREARN